jgi:hypothetical protein
MSRGPVAGPAARARAYERQQAAMRERDEQTTERMREIIAEADGERRAFFEDLLADRLERLGR